ncbi:MAG: glycosyltransferase family 4 protein [Algoriphagus aquaeductus]|uniref:glycosyltransferase family 4 protein n=1 Tax=Algoriphagus aquaeductus TaxID=475299 RepID=UPI003879C185
MKRVLFFIDSFPNYSETFIYNQIYYLLDQGFLVEVLSIKKKIYDQNVVHLKMVEYNLQKRVRFLRHGLHMNLFINLLIFPLVSFRLLSSFSFKKSLFLIQNLEIFNNYRYFDLIHVHYGHIGALVGDLRSCGLFENQKLVCSFHGEELLPVYLNSYHSKYSNMIKFFDAITVNSLYTKNLVLNALKIGEQIVYVLPVGLDLNFFKPSRVSKDQSLPFSILFVGRLINWKAPILAIQIVEELLKLNFEVKLNIIGSGPEYKKCYNYVVQKNLNNFVLFHGALNQESIREFYNTSDLFLYPGIRDPETLKCEAQGLVIQEAQAMQVPVIISEVGGMKYGIINGETGFSVAEGDLNGFVEKILILLTDSELRLKMGKNGREFVTQEYDIEVLGKKMIKIYNLN